MKGEAGTGHVLDILLIVFILGILVVFFTITGVSLTDILNLSGAMVRELWDWFILYFEISIFNIF